MGMDISGLRLSRGLVKQAGHFPLLAWRNDAPVYYFRGAVR